MSEKTSIEWTDATWNPIRYRVRKDAGDIARAKGYTSLVQIAEKMAAKNAVGQHCEHVSPGCANCYSGTWQARCLPVNGTGLPFDRRSRDLVEPFIDENELLKPLKWKTPKKVFAVNQSDLLGEWVPDEMIDQVFAVMALAERHTFQVLTKRSNRMREYSSHDQVGQWNLRPAKWPLDNCWLGVSVEDQPRADERILDLLATPAAVRFLSVEPMLGPIVANLTGIDWVICGGESGPGARPMHPDWARSLRDQCARSRVPFFFKQWGEWGPEYHPKSGEAVGHSTRRFMDTRGGRLYLVGKKLAGRLLDGVEWSQFPEAPQSL